LAQLNFQLPDDLLARIDAARPEYLDRKGFLCLLIDQALDASVTLGVQSAAGTPSSSKAVKAVTSSKNISNKSFSLSFSAELEPSRDLIEEFWRIKKGSKGETAWKLLTGELLKIRSKHGNTVMREQLTLAINGKWQGITLKNYENFSAPKGHAPRQQEQGPAQPRRGVPNPNAWVPPTAEELGLI
jgi:hypothetical protein